MEVINVYQRDGVGDFYCQVWIPLVNYGIRHLNCLTFNGDSGWLRVCVVKKSPFWMASISSCFIMFYQIPTVVTVWIVWCFPVWETYPSCCCLKSFFVLGRALRRKSELVRAGPEELCWENGLLKISFESFEELERTAFFSKKSTLW